MKKFFLFLILFIVSFTTACNFTGNSGFSSSGSAYEVTDDENRIVRLPYKPIRIVSLTYGTDEILLGLVDIERIKGLSKYAGNPDISFVSEKEKEMVGVSVELNAEQIASLTPDLVLASPAISKALIHTLEEMKIPVYIAASPNNWEEMEKRIRGISRAVDEIKRGDDMIAEMNEKKKILDEKLSVITPGKERVALGLYFRGILGKKGTLFCEVLRMAHVKDGAEDIEIPRGSNAYLSNEMIPRINPDVLLMPAWRVKDGDNPDEFANEMMTNPAYQNVKAVKNHRLVPLQEKYKYVMSQHLVDAIEATAKAVYPELWEDCE